MSSAYTTEQWDELTTPADGFVAECPIDRWAIRNLRGVTLYTRSATADALTVIRLLRRGYSAGITDTRLDQVREICADIDRTLTRSGS